MQKVRLLRADWFWKSRYESTITFLIFDQVERVEPRQLQQVFFLVRVQLALELVEVLLVSTRYNHVACIGGSQLIPDVPDLVEVVGTDDRLEPKLGVLGKLAAHELLRMLHLIELVDDQVDLEHLCPVAP